MANPFTGLPEPPPPPPPEETKTVDSAGILTLLGLACLAIGLYYLVLEPGNPDGSGLSGGTVTIHRLYMGQTFTLAGVIFCAAAWRPR